MTFLSNALIEDVKKLISISENFPKHIKHKVLGIGMIGELLGCDFMKWEHADKLNNVGYDAIDKDGNQIQIKTFVLGNKTNMIPAFNPTANKNSTVKFIAVVILNNDLTLNQILISSKSDYKIKLIEVEEIRKSNSNSETRKERFDLTLDQFKQINNLKQVFP